jgi:hypothetical protein
MTQEELRRLDMNLTKSDSKAKPGYVRCKVGYLPEDQGFSPLDALPIYNKLREKETRLVEFIEDVATLNESHKKLQDSHTLLRSEYEGFVKLTNQREQQLNKKIEELYQRVKDLEIFTLD